MAKGALRLCAGRATARAGVSCAARARRGSGCGGRRRGRGEQRGMARLRSEKRGGATPRRRDEHGAGEESRARRRGLAARRGSKRIEGVGAPPELATRRRAVGQQVGDDVGGGGVARRAEVVRCR